MKRKSKKSMEVQTNYGKHLCLFEPDDKEGYIVTVPGLPGTVTWGKTISQAKKMAQEAIELCVECFDTVAMHARDLSHSLITKILKQAGISVQEFLRLLGK